MLYLGNTLAMKDSNYHVIDIENFHIATRVFSRAEGVRTGFGKFCEIENAISRI